MARWSRASPTAPRRGSRATTTRAARPATASRSAPRTRTTPWPTASWCRGGPGPRMTTWIYEQPEPTSTYLHPADRRVRHAPAGQDAGADEGRSAATACAATSTTTSAASRR